LTIVSALGIFYCIENKQSNSYSWKKCTNSLRVGGSHIKKLFRGWIIYIYIYKTILEPIFCFIFIFYKKNQIYTIITIHMKRTREQQQASVVAIIHNGNWEIKFFFWISCRVGQKIRLKAGGSCIHDGKY